MATYLELSGPYANFMQNPAPPGPGICPVCRGFPVPGKDKDRGCAFTPPHLNAVAPISYAPGLGQLHTALRNYKDGFSPQVRHRFTIALAAVLWRFLERHEPCVAAAAGLAQPAFDVVVTVPSKTAGADDARGQLRALVGHYCQPTAGRFRRALVAATDDAGGHEFDRRRFRATCPLDGQSVLLVDDTWTTGANAQAAASAVQAAGATRVGCVVIGRWVQREYEDHGARLDALAQGFDWETCALHTP